MRAYAVDDTRHLVALARVLVEQLGTLGREAWLREECARLEAVRWRDRRDDDPEPYRRTKGARTLIPAQLAVLRELWAWRDATARQRDKPLFRILRDETLLALAKTPPASVEDLAGVAGLSDAQRRAPAGLEILEAARRRHRLPRGRSPATACRGPRASGACRRSAHRRDSGPARRARERPGARPSVLASRAVVEDMAKRWEAGEDPWAAAELRQWQAGLLRSALT
jgi:ribonuclease D